MEFAARVTPTSGQAEPARGITIFLLRKSFADIQKEADAAEPAPDKAAFIDKLEVSPELKAWMKKHDRVDLSGPEFPKQIAPDDVLNVPEFSKAFSDRNSGDRTIRLPVAKYLKTDQKKYPEKYALELNEYHTELRDFIEKHPETLETLDIALDEVRVNPGPKWQHLLMERTARVHRRAMQLAGTTYLAASTDSDLNGRGRFSGLPAGTYWLSTLEVGSDFRRCARALGLSRQHDRGQDRHRAAFEPQSRGDRRALTANHGPRGKLVAWAIPPSGLASMLLSCYCSRSTWA